MATHERKSGITIEAPDDVAIGDALPTAPGAAARAPRTRGGRSLPKGPVAMPGAPAATPADDPVVAAMIDQDLTLVDAVDITPAATATRRGKRGPSKLSVDVEENEDSVILFEQDGVYSWRYPDKSETVKPKADRRGPVQPRSRRRVTFDLSVEPSPDAAARRRRGPISDFVVGKVRAYVFKFVARVAVDSAIGFLERKKRTGLVHITTDDPTQWAPFERLDSLPLPTDRPARILLLVHGTFSSTLGCYGALGVSAWGKAFLANARAQYDAVIGYDHRTLSRDPLQNAEDLLGRLEQAKSPALEIDAVAHSRGGLVLRSLIEYLLPNASLRARVRRAIFVGATNGGTVLASRDNWNRLIDLTTNLVAVGCKALTAFAPAALAATIVKESVDTLGALVKALATELTTEEAVPGLAAMVPGGRFVAEINRAQPGQPNAADSLYYVVSSEFDVEGILAGNGAPEFPQRLARWAADAIVGAQMREANDLVVNTASMSAIDAETGGFVKDSWHFAKNPHVYHTVYFTREEVLRAMTRWLGMDARGERIAGAVPAGADDRFVIVRAEEPLKAALDAIDATAPSFVIAEREVSPTERYRYAYRSEEVQALGRTAGRRAATLSLEAAAQGTPLEMHEGSSTPEATPESLGSATTNAGPAGERLIVLAGTTPRAIIERGTGMATSEQLGRATVRASGIAPPSGATRTRGLPPMPAGPRRTRGGPAARTGARAKPPAAPQAAPQLPPMSPPPPPPPRAGRPVAANGGGGTATARGTVFVSGDMPQELRLGDTVSVNVVVSHDQLVMTAGPTVATAKVSVKMDRPLMVQVVPKRNVTVVGDDFAEIDPAEPRTELVFRVKGAGEGPGEVWVQVAQGPVVLTKLVLLPTVVAKNATPAAGRSSDAADGSLADPDAEQYPVLQIFESQVGDKLRYHFVVQLGDGQYLSKYSAPLQRSREEYVDWIYKEIENRWLSNDEDFAAFEQELRTYGATLLDELVPVEVQAALWAQRKKLKAIQVVAEEPFIPWEIVHLKEPGKVVTKERNFLGDKGLVRWLHNEGPAPRALKIRKDRSFYVIPKYPHPEWDLPEAQKEIPFLKKTFGSKPLEPKNLAITDLLGTTGSLDHFHFSGHGEAETKEAVFAQLMLGGTLENGEWVPRYLKSDVIAQTAQLLAEDGGQPVVMLNACQIGRLGWKLTSIGGFAQSFIDRGAGVFVGSLWSVGDVPARHFSEAFYTSLAAGKTLAESATAGRNAARDEGDGTYLAFVVYGAPYAKVAVTK